MESRPEERDPQFRTRLEALFEDAIALPRVEREAYIEFKCTDSPELRDRLRRLLAAYEESA